MSTTLLDVQAVRRRFSSLQGEFAFLDAPGGSQVPDEVGDAIARALREASANLGAPYETGRRVELILNDARADAGRFLGCSDHDGGVAPWVELAADRGFEVDWVEVTEDLRLDLDDLERKLDERVRVVAFV